jgi:ABC-type glycerol-3-phosphate transport system permease component
MKPRKQSQWIWQAAMIAGCFVFLLPLFWAAASSLKPDYQVLEVPARWLPETVVWANYPAALAYVPFLRYALNTLIIAAASIAGNLLSCSVVAYGFARLKAPGKKTLFILMLSTMMLVEPVRMIPLYLEFKTLGMIDTFLPLILPAFFGSPFYIFLLRQFFLNVPLEYEEVAVIEGAGPLYILSRIFLPLARPALATVAILNFQGVWQDFLQPLIFLHDHSRFTISLGLNFFRSSYDVQWAKMMAASLMALLPVLLVFALFQRQFLKGISFSGLKR